MDMIVRISLWFRAKAWRFKNARHVVEPDSTAAEPVRRLIEAVQSHLPPIPYVMLSKSDKTLVEICVYLNYHRLPQVVQILEELLAEDSTDAVWIREFISTVEAAGKLPETKPEDQRRAMEKERHEWRSLH